MVLKLQSDLNTFKDTFIPNPSCNYFDEYEFIGKLMGACLRSKETLALYLAPFFGRKYQVKRYHGKMILSLLIQRKLALRLYYFKDKSILF